MHTTLQTKPPSRQGPKNSPAALAEELRDASRTLHPCACGSAVVMAYEPGATFIHCLAESRTIAALPDWAPAELASTYNQPTPTP